MNRLSKFNNTRHTLFNHNKKSTRYKSTELSRQKGSLTTTKNPFCQCMEPSLTHVTEQLPPAQLTEY